MPHIVAAEMYADYQRLHPGWPEIPPEGLKFAVDPASTALKSTKAALVVSLEVQQTGSSASASSVPPFLADPYLDLDNPTVQNSILRQGVDKSAYKSAREWQTYFQDHTLLEEFKANAVLIQDPGQFHHPAQDHDSPAPGQEPAEEFGDVNVADIDVSHMVASGYEGQQSDVWPAVPNPVASHTGGYGQLDPFDTMAPYDSVALWQSFGNMTVQSYADHGTLTPSTLLPPSAYQFPQPQPQPYTAPPATTQHNQVQGKGKGKAP